MNPLLPNTRRPTHALTASLLFLFAAGLGCGSIAKATASMVVEVDGKTAVATQTVGGMGERGYKVEFTLKFDNPQNLTQDCLGVSAQAVAGVEFDAIQNRLPAGISFDPAYPVVVTVSPRTDCSFSFNNAVDIEMHTRNLVYAPQGPYRLYKATIGGSFRDITSAVLKGSVRARGRSGGFSQFVIAKDELQPVGVQIQDGLAQLQVGVDAAVTAQRMNEASGAPLKAASSNAQRAFDQGDFKEAQQALEEFEYALGIQAGVGVPNEWRPGQSETENTVGDLVARSAHLRFLLGRLNGDP